MGRGGMAEMDVDPVSVSDDESDDEDELYQCEAEEEEEEEDDSDSDPTFQLVDETEKALPNLSMKKSKRRIAEKQEHEEGDSESFEAVEKLIKDGKVNKLKIDHCKAYLKHHGLRRTGKKDVLLSRIKKHLELKDGNGEKKYPVASFTLNCQGDACLGDVVMFKQKVYQMFSIASRSATGPPIGKRTVAGRIVNESYGEAKQQHTFTIEVLWSKGVKPLPPLHPLLIKGRNLYKLRTMRQKWDNEGERKRILQEKHERGNLARLSRERRINEKRMRKTQRKHRKMEKSHCTVSTKPKPKFQDVTNLSNHEKSQKDVAREMDARIQRNPPTRPNFEFVLSSGSFQRAFEQPPNGGYTVLAAARNISISGPLYQWSNGYNRQVPQQEPYYGGVPQRQVNHGYDVHGPVHGRSNAPPVPRQLCRYHMQGLCRFGHDCKFRHE